MLITKIKTRAALTLAVSAMVLAVFATQFIIDDASEVHAATGVIDALNVGTCLATNDDVFEEVECELYDRSERWEIRDEVKQVSTLYATYAFDPKTAWVPPRAILLDSDLLKISIYDPGRDRRDSVLVAGDGLTPTTEERDDIKSKLASSGLIASDAVLDFETNARVTVRNSSGSVAKIENSGSHTINFTGATSYKPMDVDGNIRFFGCIVATGLEACVLTGSGGDRLNDITSYLEVDEDRTSGSNSPNVAPWLAVNASVPSEKDVLIYAIYYETSDQEDMVGGNRYYYCSDASERPDRARMCDGVSASERNTSTDVKYTDGEIRGNAPLLVRATSRGDISEVNLHLTETGLFTGRYEGYLRLTDPNGDGRIGDTDAVRDWGRQIRDGSGSNISYAAVLGVVDGPIYIEYEDSDGRNRSLPIMIDYDPPRIDIDEPQHGTASDDYSPDFIGSFEDYDSGLAYDSFRLVVDNDADSTRNSDFALDGIAPNANRVRGLGTNGSVDRPNDYTGFSASGNDPFAIVDPQRLYRLGDERCGTGGICHIRGDDHDDGAVTGRFDDSLRLRLESDDREFGVDFQAFAVDLAGNIGFSDSDPSNPYFINDLGTEDPSDRIRPNVLGYYSAHIVGVDEKDPEISTTRSATGYYGLDRDSKPIPDRRGLMLVFDGPIAPSSVSLDTFFVELDDGTEGVIVDVTVNKQYVFLKLSEDLASDATPFVGIAAGQSVRDRAGNITSGRELQRFRTNDGISPNLKVTLSGGSGTGDGAEGPSRLTNRIINIHIASDEDLQGQPSVLVVCESLSWERKVGNRTVEYDIDDFIANRIGAFNGKPSEPSTTTYTCGYDDNGDGDDDEFELSEFRANSRPGDNWQTDWINTRSGSTMLHDGQLRVIVYARDLSRHVIDGQYVQSWGAGSASFTLDTDLASPLKSRGGTVYPRDDAKVSETRPFILIEFSESTGVTIDSAKLDGVEIGDEFEMSDPNRYVYWPPSMAKGMHEVEVIATDAAGNSVEFDFEFESVLRGDFVINLVTGWNAISLPADPIDSGLHAVFTDPAVQSVIGWDTDGWRVAVRRNGVWESSDQFAPLTSVRARYGYWVKASTFASQRVALVGPVYRGDGRLPSLVSIPTEPGWNFVGVIDVDGDQTENHFGDTLLDSRDNPVTAENYLGADFTRAYTWDATFNRFALLRPTDTITIGTGIWVYYSNGTGIAP